MLASIRRRRTTAPTATPTPEDMLPATFFADARRRYAQVDGIPEECITAADAERYDGYTRGFIAELPLDVLHRLADPEGPTWEQSVTNVLKAMFTPADVVEVIEGDPEAFRMLVFAVRDEATRCGKLAAEVLKRIEVSDRVYAMASGNPAAYITNLLQS